MRTLTFTDAELVALARFLIDAPHLELEHALWGSGELRDRQQAYALHTAVARLESAANEATTASILGD